MSSPPSSEIIEAIEDGTVQVLRKAEIYRYDGETLWRPEGPGTHPKFRLLTDGSVSIDYDRDERRTVDISFDNSDNLLRPHANGFWYDKVIKLWRGLKVGSAGAEEWWQIGEFCIDSIDDKHFPRVVHVVGRDYTKRMLNSRLKNSASFDSGIKLDEIIKALAVNSGVPAAKLAKITGIYPTLSKKVDVERNTDRWSIAKDVSNSKNHDIWFDAEGFLRLEKFPDPTLGPPEWTFKTGKDGNLVDYDRSVNDSELYNVVQVQGAAPEGGLPAFWEARNTEPSSPTSIAEIGERVMPLVTLDAVATEAECKDIALSLLRVAGLESYALNFNSILYPWLDVGTVVQVFEDDRLPGDPTRFLLTSIDMPIQLGPQGNTGKRITVVGDTTGGYDEEEPSIPPIDETPEEPETPPTNPVEPPDNPVGVTEEIRIATFNVFNGHRTDLVAGALDRVAEQSDMIGIQEGNDAGPALTKFLNSHPGWGVWRGANETQKRACCILYRKSIGTVTGKKFTKARDAKYLGPVGRPERTGAKFVAELEIKLKKSQRTITHFNVHTIAGMFASRARMGNPEWQIRQDYYKDHIATLVNRIDACNNFAFVTGDFNQLWDFNLLNPLTNRTVIDHNYATHTGTRIDFVAHRSHAAISVVDTKKLEMAASDHDVVIVTYKIRGA